MSSFNDTSSWKKKDGTTLVYPREHDGETDEGSSKKQPNLLQVQLQHLSVLNRTYWELKDDKKSESEASFATWEFISGLGLLENCRIRTITLDENENEAFTQLHVNIYPIELKKLQATAMVDTLSIIGKDKDKLTDGWMSNEIGRIHYHSAGEYYDSSVLFASLFLSQDKFENLVREIKLGNIRTARLGILADVFEIGWEGWVADIKGHISNYAILCEDEGENTRGYPKGTSGYTNARLQEVTLEWSPKLELKMASGRDESDEDDYLAPETEPVERDIKKVVTQLARDVRGIRGRMETFYQGAIIVIVYLVAYQVSKWFGF